MIRPETTISFVVDAKPVFQTQAWLLLHNLCCLALPDRTAILLNHCGPLAPELRGKAEDCGATIQPIARFGDGPAAYCNKLQQFDGVLALGADHAVLCDTDIGFLSPPVAWGSAQAVCAKTVDISNPPEPLFRRMLELAGMGDVPLDHQPQFGRHLRRGRTHPLNCNGGLYLLPTDLLRQLAPVWRKWADFCLGHAPELGKAAVHCDQLGFALAMLELDLPFEALDTARNFPLHFAAKDYAGSANTAPTGLHYHKTLQADGRLVTLAPPGPIQTAVARFNAMVHTARRDPGFQALLGRSHAPVTA